MTDPSELNDEERTKGIEMVKERLPEDADLALLCFTGSRAFVWANRRYDIDCRGFFADPGWFSTCHLGKDGYDMTLTNINSLEDPDINYDHWNTFVDTSKPFYINEDFDYDNFRDHCTWENIKHAYPYNIRLQLKRLEAQWSIRSALHSYKEVMYPLHFLYYDFLEINVMKINEKPEFQYDGLKPLRDSYFDPKGGRRDIDKDLVWNELEEMFDRIDEELERLNESEETDS